MPIVSLGQTAAPSTPTPTLAPTYGPLLIGGGLLLALIVLPGASKLLVPAGLAGLLIAGNWKQCTADANSPSLIDHTTGLNLSNQPGPMGTTMSTACPAGHTCSLVSPNPPAPPAWSCLTNVFPGGL